MGNPFNKVDFQWGPKHDKIHTQYKRLKTTKIHSIQIQ